MYRHLPALELATCCAAAASCAPTRQPCLQTAVLHWHVQIFANFIVRLTVSMLNCIQGVRTPIRGGCRLQQLFIHVSGAAAPQDVLDAQHAVSTCRQIPAALIAALKATRSGFTLAACIRSNSCSAILAWEVSRPKSDIRRE